MGNFCLRGSPNCMGTFLGKFAGGRKASNGNGFAKTKKATKTKSLWKIFILQNQNKVHSYSDVNKPVLTCPAFDGPVEIWRQIQISINTSSTISSKSLAFIAVVSFSLYKSYRFHNINNRVPPAQSKVFLGKILTYLQKFLWDKFWKKNGGKFPVNFLMSWLTLLSSQLEPLEPFHLQEKYFKMNIFLFAMIDTSGSRSKFKNGNCFNFFLTLTRNNISFVQREKLSYPSRSVFDIWNLVFISRPMAILQNENDSNEPLWKTKQK